MILVPKQSGEPHLRLTKPMWDDTPKPKPVHASLWCSCWHREDSRGLEELIPQRAGGGEGQGEALFCYRMGVDTRCTTRLLGIGRSRSPRCRGQLSMKLWSGEEFQWCLQVPVGMMHSCSSFNPDKFPFRHSIRTFPFPSNITKAWSFFGMTNQISLVRWGAFTAW